MTPVSEADRAVERALRERLDETRPDEPVFGSGERYDVTGRSLLLFVLQNGSERSVRGAAAGFDARSRARRSDDASRA